jgi:putative transposase
MAKPLKVEGPVTPEDANKAYEATMEPHDRERLIAIRMAQQGDYTLEQIGSSLNRGRATIARWLKAYREGGVQKLLHRAHGGRLASLSKSHQDALTQGLRSGRWETTREIQAWLQKEQGVDLSLSGVYYWIYRLRDGL